MSLFAAHVGKMEAHVICDTLGYRGDGSLYGIALKARPLSPRNAVLAGLGAYAPYDAIVNRLMQVFGNLDELAENLPRIAREEWSRYWNADLAAAAEYLGYARSDLDVGKLQLALVGYSSAAQQFVVYACMNTGGQDFNLMHYRPPQFVTGPPVDLTSINAKKPRLPEDLTTVGKRQYQLIQESGVGCGGELLHYRIKRHYLQTKVIHEFPNYQEAMQELKEHE